MTRIFDNLQVILAKIQDVAVLNKVNLLAVSKAQPVAAIREAYAAGVHMMGENYLQEALDKQANLTDLPIEWHFIGPIQSNKTQQIAQHFAWVHSVDRLKIAQRLNDARRVDLPPLQVCLQVNVSGEASKSGALPEFLPELAAAVIKMPRLKLRGVMAIPAPTQDYQQQSAQFKQVRQCYDSLLEKGFKLDVLSMGMSDDYEVAIKQGATIVRIGSALFGARKSIRNNKV